MKITMTIDNVYPDETVTTTVTDDIPGPDDTESLRDWGEDTLFQYTGTGRTDGDSAHFLRITECDDPRLVGAEFEWGL